MTNKLIVTIVFLLTTAGCSTYDVLAISSDVAMAVFTDVNEGKKPSDDNWHSFWDPAVSGCIKHEHRRNAIVRRLDEIEHGKEYVVLPTGEKVSVAPYVLDQATPEPTRKCLNERANARDVSP